MAELRLERLPSVLERYPRSKASFHSDVKSGLMIPAVRLGARCSAYPSHEVDAVIAARVAGKSDDEVRQLVAELVARRKEAA